MGPEMSLCFLIWSAKYDLSVFICVPLSTYTNKLEIWETFISKVYLSHQVFVILCPKCLLDSIPPIYLLIIQAFITFNLEYTKAS